MRIAVIGGRDYQQFPIISYGGIETCVENMAWGLHKAQKDFVCIVPKRQVVQDYPFEVIESSAPPLPGAEANVWPFANSLPDIVKAVKPDVIWSQGFWSAETLKDLGIPIICTFQDFVPDINRKNSWFTYRENTWYRFISQFQFNQWVDGVSDRLRGRSFYLHTGLADDEYDYGPPHEREDYYLWVAGLNWGWHIKGLDLFIELAKRNPHKVFIAYGTGNRGIETALSELHRTLSNFEFRGMLKRGQAHRSAFAKARLFLMPTQMPEPLGRTVIESMSKGTPVLGSTNGALPELIKNGVSGFTAKDIDEYERLLDAAYDYAECFNYAKRFHIEFEIESLLERSQHIIGGHITDMPAPLQPTETTHISKPGIENMSIESILNEAMQRHQNGDLPGAETLYNSILAKDPADPDALNLLGVLHLQRRQLDKAEMYIHKAIDADPAVAEFHHNLGDVLNHKGQTEAAIESYRHSLGINPTLEIAQKHLAALCKKRSGKTIALNPLKRNQVVQAVLDRTRGHTYLEVGVDAGDTFVQIRTKRKIGVDPVPTQKLIQEWVARSRIECFKYNSGETGQRTRIFLEGAMEQSDPKIGPDEQVEIYYTTSDSFFEKHAPGLFGQNPIDVIFLDGLHTYTQTFQDVCNALKFIKEDGFILIHDCNPPTEVSAFPADSWEAARRMNLPGWNGLWCGDGWKSILRLRATRDDLQVFVLDCDYGIGVVRKGRPENMLTLSLAEIETMTWADFRETRTEWLNLKSQDYLYDFLNSLNND